ncbi:phosphoglycerate mutase-like protein 4 [Rutidosis leptorrhynchoides]|uniref:phosphoglycerate mutase-like protein 4 n=1 Tax=Rutidosis leptorrhynchoides TaxID=125765 RepID=UPI003A998B12
MASVDYLFNDPHHLHVTHTFGRKSEPDQRSGEELSTVDKNITEIIVVRRGQTVWNAAKRIHGHLDIGLNDAGKQQAVAVAKRLAKEFEISAVYSSDLKRALETAETIANSCGAVEVIQDPNLRERHFGELQGVLYSEAPAIKRKAYEGGGESLNQLYKRCTTSVQTIATKHRGERVVVVTHSGVIRALHWRVSNGKSDRAEKIVNVSVNVLHLSDSDEWVIKSWGDVSHLNGAKFL